MSKRKKIIVAITIPTAAFLITLLCLSLIYAVPFWIESYQRRGWTKLDYCEYQWEISLPKEDVAIEYNFSNRGGFHGDGTEYTVCKYSTRPDEFLENFENDLDGKYAEKYNRILPLMKTKNRRDEYIDESKLFSSDGDLVWQSKIKDGNCALLLAYDERSDTLYIIEDFT